MTAVLSVTLPQKQSMAMAEPKHVPSMQAADTAQRRPSIDSSLDTNNGGKAAGTAAAAAAVGAAAGSPKGQKAGQSRKGTADPKEVNLQPKGLKGLKELKRGCTCTLL